MKSIFNNIGINYKCGKFEGVWIRACEIENRPDHKQCSVRGFLQAVKEMHHMK